MLPLMRTEKQDKVLFCSVTEQEEKSLSLAQLKLTFFPLRSVENFDLWWCRGGEGGGFPQKSWLFLQNSEYDSFLNACNFLFICAPKTFSRSRSSDWTECYSIIKKHLYSLSPHLRPMHSATKGLAKRVQQFYTYIRVNRASYKGWIDVASAHPLSSKELCKMDTALATFCVPASKPKIFPMAVSVREY